MSLEKDIQDLAQSVNLLCKAVDLNTATLSDLNGNLLEFLNNQAGQPNIQMQAQGASDHKAKEPTQTEELNLTDDQVKESGLYTDFQNLMSEYVSTAKGYKVPEKEAIQDAIKLLKRFSSDGKVLSLVRALLEGGDIDEVARIKTEFQTAIHELVLANTDKADTTAGGPEDVEDASDFDDDDDAKTYTDEDVKKALRAYAAVEGRPAAVAKLKELTGGKTAVKDIPADQYPEVIAGLRV